ncbi:NUDIX hydrolase, partial [Streptomyces albiflaviniger]|nr:NUDIX hydrolase [Streptomyces albiflaviniger]
MATADHSVLHVLTGYRPKTTAESADVERVRGVIETGAPWDRMSPLHLTASALIVHPDSGRVLLRWHQRHQSWLLVGGHGDPGEYDPHAIA